MPFELTFADDFNQFLYYNNMMPEEEMLASRRPSQVNFNPMAYCQSPERARKAATVVNMLRTGKKKIRLAVPGNGPDKCVLHDYIAMHDKDGRYRGVNEQIYDLMPDIKWYLKHTGQKLVEHILTLRLIRSLGLHSITIRPIQNLTQHQDLSKRDEESKKMIIVTIITLNRILYLDRKQFLKISSDIIFRPS
jgi:hypothetical protein